MSTHNYKSIVVTGIVCDPIETTSEMYVAHARAAALFEDGLVSSITPVGHNFVASFAVFPSGSSQGREASKAHDAAVATFVNELSRTTLEFVVVEWGDHVNGPRILYSHEDSYESTT